MLSCPACGAGGSRGSKHLVPALGAPPSRFGHVWEGSRQHPCPPPPHTPHTPHTPPHPPHPTHPTHTTPPHTPCFPPASPWQEANVNDMRLLPGKGNIYDARWATGCLHGGRGGGTREYWPAPNIKRAVAACARAHARARARLQVPALAAAAASPRLPLPAPAPRPSPASPPLSGHCSAAAASPPRATNSTR